MTSLVLLAPLSGWAAAADEIPDEVFSKKMLGDAVAIDPLEGTLVAPCEGEIISIAASKHAIALRHAGGAEILVHVGIDTVGLAGEGFELLVRKGDRVRAGAPLLKFDLDLLARKAASLVTPVVITNSERFRIVSANLDREIAAGQPLLTIDEIASTQEVVAAVSGATRGVPVISEAVIVNHAHGIHARPAALIARRAKSLPHVLEARARGRGVDPRSAVALMSLGVRGGDEIVIQGFSADAKASVAALADIVRGLEAGPAHAPAVSRQTTPGNPVIASRGFAVGPAFRLEAKDLDVPETGTGAAFEQSALDAARARVHDDLAHRAQGATAAAADVLAAHLELLDDSALLDAAQEAIRAGKSAAFSWRAAMRASAAALRATGDTRLAERVDDLRDLERQVLAVLLKQEAAVVEIPPQAILLARDLTPSQLIDMGAGKLGGIVLAGGGPTSHVAILAGVMGIPMLVAAGNAILEIEPGRVVILDAEQGTLRVSEDAAATAAAAAEVARRRDLRVQQREAARQPCRLASGERIEVFANLVGTVADATLAVAEGAEGCGLLRTEFLFLDRNVAPDEREQLACYQQVAQVLDGRPLVIRTLDVGGDKPIPYLPLPAEENPALGLRGIRTSLWRPELLVTQLRALLQVRPVGQCRVLLPMITDTAELATVRRMLDEQRVALDAAAIPLGAMIETPAAAMLADQLARDVDFLSIGTNDLAQYALAMDRGHPDLAARIDGVHPAVLRLIGLVGEAGARQRKPVAVCGGLASDPAAVPLLLGLGVTELSAVPAAIPEIKALVSRLELAQCRALAQRALALPTAVAVRALLAESRSSSGVTA